MGLVVKNPPANVGDVTEGCWIPGSGRAPGRGHGNTLTYSCLENPMGRGAWWATVRGIAESDGTARTPVRTHTHTRLIKSSSN